MKEESPVSHQYTMPKVQGPDHFRKDWDIVKEYMEKVKTGELKVNPSAVVDMRPAIHREAEGLMEVIF